MKRLIIFSIAVLIAGTFAFTTDPNETLPCGTTVAPIHCPMTWPAYGGTGGEQVLPCNFRVYVPWTVCCAHNSSLAEQ
jgi:hypothetical protein